jgi:two-component system cell cycle sensor histidine kinase/response regulator CckA
MRKAVRPRRRVLVVDDNDAIRDLVEAVLLHAGYEIAAAASGDEAEQIASRLGTLDLLVTDERMPGMLGHQLARRLRERQPGLKVLYFTGFSDQLFDEKQSLWEDEAFLDKPCTPKSLVEAVSLLLDGRIART